MRVTKAHVQAIADQVKDLTDGRHGRIQLGAALDTGGTRIFGFGIGGRRFVGAGSLRRAAAYFLGMLDRLGGFTDGGLPDKISEAYYLVHCAGLVDATDYLNGVSDAARYLSRVARSA